MAAVSGGKPPRSDNELFPHPQGTDAGYEWVEIFNSGNSVTDQVSVSFIPVRFTIILNGFAVTLDSFAVTVHCRAIFITSVGFRT
jgi:hypothetical protein